MRRVKLVLFLLVWSSCAWFGSWEGNPNNAVRLFAAVSLVEDGDATIDEFADLTIDKARFGEHFYSDKAPGMTVMALPAVAAMHLLTGERSARLRKMSGDPALGRFLLARQWLAAATGPALLTAVAAVLLFDLALGVSGSAVGALTASLGYALGSPVWGWSTTLFGHAAVAALYVVAIWAVWRGTAGERVRAGPAFVAGLALGWAVVVEHQAVLAGSAIAVWALARVWGRAERWRALGWAAAGGVAAMLPFLGYNLLAFGTVFRLGYSGVVGFEGMKEGLFGLTAPSPAVLWEITVGTKRGLVWVAPALLLGGWGLWALGERREARGLARAAGATAAAVLLVNAAYVYWDGGNSTGPRHATPAAGMLALGLAASWADADRRTRVLIGAVLAVSLCVNLVIAAGDVMASPEHDWPVKRVAWDLRLAQGQTRTWPGVFLGWTSGAGIVAFLLAGVAGLWWLIDRVRELDRESLRAGAGLRDRAGPGSPGSS